MAPLLRKLKAGPIEAEFEKDIRALEKVAPSQVIEESPPEMEGRYQMLSQLVGVNPRSAILEAWLGVESAVRKAALQRLGGIASP